MPQPIPASPHLGMVNENAFATFQKIYGEGFALWWLVSGMSLVYGPWDPRPGPIKAHGMFRYVPEDQLRRNGMTL